MDPLLEQYEAIGRGDLRPPVEYNEYKRLLANARRFVDHEDEAQRLLAIDVCGAIGRDRAMYVVRQFTKDKSEAVRRHALEVAVSDGETGVTLLRAFLDDPAEEIVLEAISWLRRAADRGSAGALRRLARHSSPRVRAAAAELIGHVGGPSLSAALRPLVQDEDEAVRAAADEAVRRIAGELPQAEPDPWWGTEEADAYEAPESVALPETLPSDIPALLRLIGQVDEEHRQGIIDHMSANHRDNAVSSVVRKTAPNKDRPLSVGAAIAARMLDRRDLVVPLRRLLPDQDPWVRIAVADTLAVIGGPSVVMGVRQLLEAPQPEVRAASVRALASLCDEKERERYYRMIDGETADVVLEALAQVRDA